MKEKSQQVPVLEPWNLGERVEGSVEIKGFEEPLILSHHHEPWTPSPRSRPVDIKGFEEGRAADSEAGAATAAICRICLEHDGDSGGDKLIAPCRCKGTQQFVHRSCLDHWRSVKEGFAFSHCTTCREQFHLRINFLEGSRWRNIKFRVFVARDIFLVFLSIQMVIAVLGGLSYLCDYNRKLRKLIDRGSDDIFLTHPVLFYYCVGAVLFLALLGVYGLVQQCIGSSHTDSYTVRSTETSTAYCCNGPYFIDCPDCRPDSSDDALTGVLVVVVVVVIVFAVIGIFYGIFMGSIGLQRIWQKHYHIRTKRELTKEYVVEDLHGHYTPPKLDEKHAERLRMLHLL